MKSLYVNYCFFLNREKTKFRFRNFDCQVAKNVDLVYGGGSIGLMGLISQAVHDGGRHVIG